ncbi:chemotaxis protein [Mycobacterium sp. CBMA 213]|nr:chemotaxis protein [Mycolicibacterium sp. CBMA 335]MUM03487.1 chemotaxis protein [Mycolicibacterium sp. CBMA 213]
MLAGTGWTASTVREAALSDRNDLATAALADGFATATRGVADLPVTVSEGGLL